jgi:hypothetical protein
MWMAPSGTSVRGELREIAPDGTMKGRARLHQPGVIRLSLTNAPSVLFDESTSEVKIHLSHLVTGP